jgi:hypothetical protein
MHPSKLKDAFMLPVGFTDTDKIRSVLGLSEKDSPDSRLVVRDLEKELNLDLSSWISGIQTIVDSVSYGSTIPAELNIVDAIGLYSTYFCAKLVIPSLQMSAIQSISDGKNSMDRFSSINWDSLYNQLSERVAFYKKLAMDNNSSVAVVAYPRFSLAGSERDSVVG